MTYKNRKQDAFHMTLLRSDNLAESWQPDCEKLPARLAVTADREPTMIFDRACEVKINFDDSLYALIDSILPPFNLMELMASQSVQH